MKHASLRVLRHVKFLGHSTDADCWCSLSTTSAVGWMTRALRIRCERYGGFCAGFLSDLCVKGVIRPPKSAGVLAFVHSGEE